MNDEQLSALTTDQITVLQRQLTEESYRRAAEERKRLDQEYPARHAVGGVDGMKVVELLHHCTVCPFGLRGTTVLCTQRGHCHDGPFRVFRYNRAAPPKTLNYVWTPDLKGTPEEAHSSLIELIGRARRDISDLWDFVPAKAPLLIDISSHPNFEPQYVVKEDKTFRLDIKFELFWGQWPTEEEAQRMARSEFPPTMEELKSEREYTFDPTLPERTAVSTETQKSTGRTFPDDFPSSVN